MVLWQSFIQLVGEHGFTTLSNNRQPISTDMPAHLLAIDLEKKLLLTATSAIRWPGGRFFEYVAYASIYGEILLNEGLDTLEGARILRHDRKYVMFEIEHDVFEQLQIVEAQGSFLCWSGRVYTPYILPSGTPLTADIIRNQAAWPIFVSALPHWARKVILS